LRILRAGPLQILIVRRLPGTSTLVLRFWGGATTKEPTMKRIVLAGVAAAAVVFSGHAIAQGVSVELAPDQRTRIKEYVVKERVAPVTVKERVRVGATLPADVELRSVPSDWGPAVSKYKYVYTDNSVHFVDPTSRRVIYDLD
jgi:hypothetical protein